jgi:hypothetical protein
VRRLLGYQGCEVFINFQVDALNRWLKHPDEAISRHIVEAFGGDECLGIAGGAGDRVENLRMLYQRQLGGIAQFVRYFEMRNRDDRRIYYLFFASNHRLGHVKMKEAMWKVDPQGEFKFSDGTNPDQLLLFENEPTAALAEALSREFKCKGWVCVGSIRRFVEDKTAFLAKHMKVVLKQQEDLGIIAVEQVKTSGEKRRKGSFPDEARVSYG